MREAAIPPPEAKLALAEFLLECDDPQECAKRCLGWLADHLGVRQALCAVVDPVMPRLVSLASRGIPTSRAKAFRVDLEAKEDPLVRVLARGEPVVLSRGNGGPAHAVIGFGSAPFLAVPVHAVEGAERVPTALILLRPVVPRAAMRGLEWAADLLGQKLGRLRFTSVPARGEGPVKRERGLLRTIINAVPDPIILTDPEGRMVIANNRAEALFASREGESEGRRRAVALNNMLFSAALGQEAITEQEVEHRELVLVDPADGSDLVLELLSTVGRDSREGTGIVSILRNVADLKRATEEIEENYRKLRLAETDVRAERDRLNLIIDSAADPILVTDPASNIVMMNTPAERLFTHPPDASAEGMQRVRSNDAHFTSFVSNLFSQGVPLRFRGRCDLADPRTGAELPMEAVSGKVLSEHGELTAVVTTLHDLTEALERELLYEQLKRASAELEEKVREATAELVHQNELLRRQAIQLEQASALKSQFLANMSHEFRTPLNAILGYTSLLLRGVSGELTPPQKDNLSRVDSNARHLVAIINDILDISRIEVGKMPLHLSEFGLRELIAEVMVEVEPIIARSTLAVGTELAPDLPRMRSDRPKVKQIVLNLLTNALKFTPKGSVKVFAKYLPVTREIAVALCDTGIGIAKADQEKVFEDFRQADDSPTRAYGGAGLGLSISRRLASMLGGKILLESKSEEGSTFTLLLPVRRSRR